MLRTEELRAFLLEFLKTFSEQHQPLQFQLCLNGVERLAREKCLERLGPGAALREEDGARLKHVVWDLILERVLVPSSKSVTSINDGWPFLSITDHGRKVIAEQKPVPYDPDGYLARLKQNTGGLHATVEAYLAEALTTFRTGNTMASAVMLGAASEMVFNELCAAIIQGFSVPSEATKFQEKTSPKKNMVERVNAVSAWLSQKKNQLPTDWQNVERHHLVHKVADIIRNRRNDSGHPQDPPMKPSHEEMYALLMMFPDYCEKLYSLKTWLNANSKIIA